MITICTFSAQTLASQASTKIRDDVVGLEETRPLNTIFDTGKQFPASRSIAHILHVQKLVGPCMEVIKKEKLLIKPDYFLPFLFAKKVPSAI